MNYIAAQTPLPRIATHPGVPNINRHGWKHQEMDDLAVLKRRACPRPLLVRMGGENDSAKTSERERGGGKGETRRDRERTISSLGEPLMQSILWSMCAMQV